MDSACSRETVMACWKHDLQECRNTGAAVDTILVQSRSVAYHTDYEFGGKETWQGLKSCFP